MFPNNTTTWTETSFFNWSLLITSNKVIYKLLRVSSVYSIASNLWQQMNMRAFRFPQWCNGGLFSFWMRRHVTEQRRWPWDAASYPKGKKASTQQSWQILKFVVTKCPTLSYSGVSPEHTPTAFRSWSEQPTFPLIRNGSTIKLCTAKDYWAPSTFNIHVAGTKYVEYESRVHNSLFRAPDSTGSDDCIR
jgi:hypothetical protein